MLLHNGRCCITKRILHLQLASFLFIRKSKLLRTWQKTVLRIRNVYHGSRIMDPKFSISDPKFFPPWIPGSASKNWSIFTQKIVFKLSEIWSGLFIPDPGVKKASDPGYGSATLTKTLHYITFIFYPIAMVKQDHDMTHFLIYDANNVLSCSRLQTPPLCSSTML